MSRKQKLDFYQEKARIATRKALSHYVIPDDLWEKLASGYSYRGYVYV